jgi:hypothetical protein
MKVSERTIRVNDILADVRSQDLLWRFAPLSIKRGSEGRSKSIPDPSMSLQEYHVLSPAQPESLDQFLTCLESHAEINITAANILDFSLLSEEFGVSELSAKCGISSVSTVSVSNFQNYSQQIEAIWNHIGRLEDSVSLFLREFFGEDHSRKRPSTSQIDTAHSTSKFSSIPNDSSSACFSLKITQRSRVSV